MADKKRHGIFYGYIVVIAASGIWMAAWGTLGTYGLFLKPLLTEFGWTRAFTAGARSVTSGISGLLGIAAGGLTDRFGPKIVLLVFGSFLGIGYLLMSQINSAWQYYGTYGVFISLGISAATIPILITVARWFVKRRGLMTGLVQAGQGIGGMILAPVVAWLILNYGWRHAYLLLGIIVLALIIPMGLLLKRDPAQVGQLPYGVDEVMKAELYSDEKSMSTAEFSLGSAVHTSQFWMLSIMLFVFGFCRTFVLVHVPAHVTDMGFSLAIGANVLAIIMGVTLVTRVVMGRLADLIGNRYAFMIGYIVTSAGLLWMLVAQELWMLYLFAAAFGFSWGTLAVVRVPIIAETFGLRSLGAISGTLDFTAQIGAFIGPLLAGQLFDMTKEYTIVFSIAAALAFTGLALTILLRPTHQRPKVE